MKSISPMFSITLLSMAVMMMYVFATSEEKPWPVVAESIPASGTENVDPSLTHITITFDRPMKEETSITGRDIYLPERTGAPVWEALPGKEGMRVCILPVKLEAGKFYSIGINSLREQNFRSLDGMPAEHTVICFATKGADAEDLKFLKPPKITNTSPENGDRNVDSNITEFVISFDQPMQREVAFIGTRDIERNDPTWSDNKMMCILPIHLFPGEEYSIALNSSHMKGFRNQRYVPLEPANITFKTSGKALDDETKETQIALIETPPVVVSLDPPLNATDVDPAKTILMIKFDRPMSKRYSIVHFGKAPYIDRKKWISVTEFEMIVELEPDMDYEMWINHEIHGMNFKSREGTPLAPVKWMFSTKSDESIDK